MYIDDKSNIHIQNLSSTTKMNADFPATLQTFNDHDMTFILYYALPLSCVAILMVLLIAVGIHRRQRILEKWTSLTRMKNTDPRFRERAGLRRDSEYESQDENVTVINGDEQIPKETTSTLATIT